MTMIEQAQQTRDETFAGVQRYMSGVGKRLVLNYLILIVVTMLLNLAALSLLPRFLPRPTVNTALFIAIIIWMIYGWRYFEQRNHATALFVLYSRYSRERRMLEDLLAQPDSAFDEASLQSQINALTETAQGFMDAAEESQIRPKP